MKLTGKIATLILLIVFFVGLCVLLYPAFSQHWNSKVQSHAIADYESSLNGITEKEYLEMLEEAYSYNRRLYQLPFPLKNYSQIEGYNDILNVNGRGMIGYLVIDKIQVELPIYHGTASEILNRAAGHFEGTSLPVGGVNTHAMLSAHRGLPSAKLFTNLDRMEIGDIFVINILNQVLTYQVDQIKTVLPSDIDDILIVGGEDYCTLQTCTPYGINTHRLLVRGHRIETVMKKTYYVTSEAFLVDRLIVTPFVALPILFGLIVYVIFKPVAPAKKTSLTEEEL